MVRSHAGRGPQAASFDTSRIEEPIETRATGQQIRLTAASFPVFPGVQLQIRTFLSLAGLLAATVTAGFAQTPTTPDPPPAAAATPNQAPADQQPARPPYDPDAEKKTKQTVQPNPPVAPQPQQTTIPPTPPPGSPTAERVYPAYPNYQPQEPKEPAMGSAYIPMDSWVYPAMMRLYSMGFLDTAFIGMRPWTRQSAVHMLRKSR